MAAGNTFEAIATTTVSGSSTSTITFSSISTDYTDLILVGVGSIASVSYFDMQVGNGSADTGTNYSFTRLIGYSGGVYTDRYSNYAKWQPNLATSGIGNIVLQIQNYSNTSIYKTMLARSSNNGAGTNTEVGLWRSTSAINYIKLIGGSGNNFDSGTVFSLYGIKSA